MKTLKDIVVEVQQVTGFSKSELSRMLGKSRNYLSTMISQNMTYDSEKDIVRKLQLIAENKYNKFEKLRQNFEIAEEKLIHLGSDYKKLSKRYKDSEHKVVMLQKRIDQVDFRLQSYKALSESQESVISTLKQDKSNLSELLDTGENQINNQYTSIKALSDAGFALGEQLHQERIKNRFLTGAILFVFVVSAVYLGAQYYGY